MRHWTYFRCLELFFIVFVLELHHKQILNYTCKPSQCRSIPHKNRSIHRNRRMSKLILLHHFLKGIDDSERIKIFPSNQKLLLIQCFSIISCKALMARENISCSPLAINKTIIYENCEFMPVPLGACTPSLAMHRTPLFEIRCTNQRRHLGARV